MKDEDARHVAQELQLLRSRQMHVQFHGESMRPLLQDGDRILVEPVDWADIRPGDLITYRSDDKFPTRRVVRKGRDALRLWCDNWPHDRFRAARDAVLGRAVARERQGVWLGCRDAEWTAVTRRGLARFRRLEVRRALGRLRALAGWLTRRGRTRPHRPA
jgi:hypothetical protein